MSAAVEVVRGLDYHVEHIRESWNASVENIIETGRRVQQALEDLPHGEKATLWERLPFKQSMGAKLASIAKDGRIYSHVNILPPAVGTLYELTKLDDEQWQRGLAEGVIHPGMERSAVKSLIKAERREKKAAAKAIPDKPAVMFRLIHREIQQLHNEVEPESVDWIITDPPYPKEFLDTWTYLGEFAAHALKPGGSVLAMSGQSYLPEVMSRMSNPMLTYYWTLSYLTPGGQSTGLFHRKVNTFWKPILWFVKGEYSGDRIGDVVKSAVNDNDKDHHHWGQSESGMADLIERFTYPGQVICDPFLGGGTTGVVAFRMGRHFIGADCDESCLEVTRERLA